jgi:uridine kinase
MCRALGGHRLAVDIPAALVSRISQLTAAQPLVLVAVDGQGGAGKSRWAALLAKALQPQAHAAIIAMDDFFLPAAERPSARPGPIGGDFDWTRLRDEVLLPLRSGRAARFRRYDWQLDALAEVHQVPPRGVVIVEGIYVTRRELAALYDLRVWVACPREVRLSRGLERDGEEARELWERDWMQAEDRYVSEHRPEELADVVVDGNAA